MANRDGRTLHSFRSVFTIGFSTLWLSGAVPLMTSDLETGSAFGRAESPAPSSPPVAAVRQADGMISLVMVSSYPTSETDHYFGNLSDLAVTDRSLFAVENFKHQVIRFEIETDSLSSPLFISRLGQGPGDLMRPSSLCLRGDRLAVKDTFGFSFFSRDGAFHGRFRAPTGSSTFVLAGDTVHRLRTVPGEDRLIESFSPDGRPIRSYGRRMFSPNASLSGDFDAAGIDRILHDGILLADGLRIIYLNSSFGRVQAYDDEGRLFSERDIGGWFGELGRRVPEENRRLYLQDGLRSANVPRGGYPIHRIFHDACIHEGTIYILRGNHVPGARAPLPECEIVAIDARTFEPKAVFAFMKAGIADEPWHLAVYGSPESPRFIVFIESEDGWFLQVFRPS